MGSDPFSSEADTSSAPDYQTKTNQRSQGGFRGYEYYQSQVDPEELFRRIFGEAFSRAGFGNHDWMDDPEPNIHGREGITQVAFSELKYYLRIISRFYYVSSASFGFDISRSSSWLYKRNQHKIS